VHEFRDAAVDAFGGDRLNVTAHCMGGLVVRTLLLNHGDQLPQVKLFVSLSTPWVGEVPRNLA
jgi:pimeloyl-ACP methyl ester carboxylesterase